ncbi:MAG: hypothetical protein R6X02_28500 [Enhygromyxa sp.]
MFRSMPFCYDTNQYTTTPPAPPHSKHSRAAHPHEARQAAFQDERELPNVPSAAKGWDLEELDLDLREIDVRVDEYTAAGQWDGSSVDVGAEQGRAPSPAFARAA